MPANLALLIRSGNPLISIETADEPSAIELIEEAALRVSRSLWIWSMTEGLVNLESGPDAKAVIPPGLPLASLQHVKNNLDDSIVLFQDLGPHCKDAMVHRTMRDLLQVCPEKRTTLVMIDSTPLPEEIRPFTVRFELGWPSTEELEQVVKDTFLKIRSEHSKRVKVKLSKHDMEQMVQSLRGLTCNEVERIVASAIYDDYTLDTSDLAKIVEGKRRLLSSAGGLESIVADISPSQIGGLNNLKQWLKNRRGGFSQKAIEFGLEPPRGILMLGIPGCGKSLCAKVVAAEWHMPLLRLDPGVLYQKFIGESESQLRQALRQAEAMAPVVLWIDEIEKAFASASASSADGGLSKRMFGTLLSWMQDHRFPIFIMATANDVQSLPPELMRKGRFDEVFFIDLPEVSSRKKILEIHLGKRNRDSAKFQTGDLAEQAEGFSGSELEQVVISALFVAFSRDEKLTDEHLSEEISKTSPLSRLMKERIFHLREWSKNRCVPAD